MLVNRLLVLLLVSGLPAAVSAEIEAGDVPGEAEWYLHADLDAMRAVESGSVLYQWLDHEVFAEIDKEIGIDLNQEVDAVTAFADSASGTVIIVEGPITEETRDKLLALAAVKARLDTLTYDGETYYHVQERKESRRHGRLEDFDGSAWFTFGIEDKLIVTSERKQLEALLESGGRVAGMDSHAGSLFVLTADKEFVQAGAHTAELTGDDESDWDSNILRNTEKAALLIADRNGLLALEARLVSRDPTIAQSLGGIVNGLISLQAFNTDAAALHPGFRRGQSLAGRAAAPVGGRIFRIVVALRGGPARSGRRTGARALAVLDESDIAARAAPPLGRAGRKRGGRKRGQGLWMRWKNVCGETPAKSKHRFRRSSRRASGRR